VRPGRRGTARGVVARRAALVAGAEQVARALVALLDHPDPDVRRRAACLILDLIGAGNRPKRAMPIQCIG
jgi:HEAT repeat protein